MPDLYTVVSDRCVYFRSQGGKADSGLGDYDSISCLRRNGQEVIAETPELGAALGDLYEEKG